MIAIRKVVCGTVLMASVSAGPAVAQGAKFSLGVGLTVPTGELGDGVNTGFHALGGVSFQPTGFPVGIRVDAMFHRMGVDDLPVVGDVDASFQVLQGTANAVYRFQTSDESKLHPYLIGGLGFYNYRFTGDDVPDSSGSETDFGINVGAGVDFTAGSLALFAEGRFHNVFAADDNVNFIPLTVGVRLGGN